MTTHQIKPSNKWSNILINAIITLSIGAMLILVPNTIYQTIIIGIGIVLFIAGVGFLVYASRSHEISFQSKSFWYIQSVINIVVGIFIFFQPAMVVNLLHYFISIWLIIVGGVQLFFASTQRSVYGNVSVLLINSILALGLGVLFLVWPEFPLVVIGYITVLIGLILLFYSYIFFKHRNEVVTVSYDSQDSADDSSDTDALIE